VENRLANSKFPNEFSSLEIQNIDLVKLIFDFMARETQKKIAEISLKCFTCSTTCVNQEKIYIFGKSSSSWPEIILQSLDVDLRVVLLYAQLNE